MNKIKTAIVLLIVFFTATKALAQSTGDASAIVKEGIELNNQKKYDEALAKYQEALKLDPDHIGANYQSGFTLYVSGKGMAAVPYLEKVLKLNASAAIITSCYSLLGSIYDQAHQPQKSIDYYKEGIKASPDDQSLHYNLGLTYFRNKQYPEAEQEAIASIKLDPKYASAQRLYALVTFHQNKRMPALMGFCSFLLLEPQTARSVEAFGNIQHILQGGALKPDGGVVANDALTLSLNNKITAAVAEAAKQKHASPADLLAAQLKAIFNSVGLARDKQDFFWNYQADFFYQLAQTPHMPAFARLVSATANNGENAQWIKANAAAMDALDQWVKGTERKF